MILANNTSRLTKRSDGLHLNPVAMNATATHPDGCGGIILVVYILRVMLLQVRSFPETRNNSWYSSKINQVQS